MKRKQNYVVLEDLQRKKGKNVMRSAILLTFLDSHFIILLVEEGNILFEQCRKKENIKQTKTERQENEVLLLLAEKKSIKARDIIEKLKLSKPTVTRIFERLLKKNKIKRIGHGAGSYYIKAD